MLDNEEPQIADPVIDAEATAPVPAPPVNETAGGEV